MKKILISCVLALAALSAPAQTTLYSFTVKDADGKDVSLEKYRGQVVLVVNSATKCGFTPQYTELEDLYEDYKDQGFVILDFPCNQFGEQAPGSMKEIRDFCTSKYHVQFPQMMKIDVNGPKADPLFTWLKKQKGFSGFGNSPTARLMDKMLKDKDKDYASNSDIKWNFTKFLIDREGNVIARFEPTWDPDAAEEAIKKTLLD